MAEWEADQLDELAQEAGYASWERWVAAVAAEKGHDICGEPTLREPHGPCTRTPAWGVDGEDEGPCQNHTAGARAQRQDLKKEVLELYSSGTISMNRVAEEVGVDQSWIWRLQATDPQFREELHDLRKKVEAVRRTAVEDALFEDCIEGDHKGGERMFYLVNRGEGRWKHITQVKAEVSGKVEVEHSPGEAIAEKIDRAAERLGVGAAESGGAAGDAAGGGAGGDPGRDS